MFYKNILTFFNELKNLYSYDVIMCKIWSYLLTYKEIPVGGKPVLIKEWFDSNIWSIRDSLNSNG